MRAYRLRDTAEDPGVPLTRIEPRALLIPPGFPDFMSRRRVLGSGAVQIEGRAWSGWAQVTMVEVSVDGGDTWAVADLEPAPDSHGWARWAWTVARGEGQLPAVRPRHGCERPDATACAALESRRICEQHHPKDSCLRDQFGDVGRQPLKLRALKGVDLLRVGKGAEDRSAGGTRGKTEADRTQEVPMGFADKAKNKAEELAGKAKAAMGDATDNRDLEAEGRMQESKADVKQAGENVKDSQENDVADALRAASGATKFEDGDTTR